MAAIAVARMRSFSVDGGPSPTLTSSAGAKKRSSNWLGEVGGDEAEIDLEEPLQAPRLEVARADEHLLAVGDERLRVQHGRIPEDLNACIEEPLMVKLLGRTARPVVRARRHEHAHSSATKSRLLDPADHAAVCHVRVDHVERVPGSVDELRDRGRDRPEPPRGVVEDDGGHRSGARVEGREQPGGAVHRNDATQPAEAGDEDELQLRDDRSLDADEQVVELAVLEVILDPGASDPADAAVDNHDLAVVDVPQAAEVPAGGATRVERAAGCARLDRARHAHLDPGLGEALVELSRASLGVGALPVDDYPHGHAGLCFRDEQLGEPVAHDPGTEPELVDVHGRCRGGDVGEDRWIEVAALDVERHRRGCALLELDRELATFDLRGREDALGRGGDASLGDDASGHGALTLLPRPSVSVAVSSPEWISAAGGGSRITRSSETCRRWRS